MLSQRILCFFWCVILIFGINTQQTEDTSYQSDDPCKSVDPEAICPDAGPNIDCSDLPRHVCACNRLPPSTYFHECPCGAAIKELKQKKKKTPPVECYFTLEQRSEHLEDFRNGVSWLAPKHVLEHFSYGACDLNLYESGCKNNTWLGDEKGQFVAIHSVQEDMLKEARKRSIVQKDIDVWWEYVDNELGFNTEYSFLNPGKAENPTIIWTVLQDSNDERYNLRMASGNERGAFPEEWLPGGYLSNGKKEAVVDLVLKTNTEKYIVFENGKFVSNPKKQRYTFRTKQDLDIQGHKREM